jgi:hypothetical protein
MVCARWFAQWYAPVGANNGMLSASWHEQWYAPVGANDGIFMTARWWSNALIERPMASRCSKFMPNGGAMLNFSARWQRNALILRPMAGSVMLRIRTRWLARC